MRTVIRLALILAPVTIAPDSMLGFRATPGVRTFAEQNKAALRDQTEKFYDYVISLLNAAPESTLLRDATVFGGAKPAWLWVAAAHSHGAWTLGQTVPYLRMNKVTPPAFAPF